MIVATGVDLAEVDRIGRALERFGERFLRRVFTLAEGFEVAPGGLGVPEGIPEAAGIPQVAQT